MSGRPIYPVAIATSRRVVLDNWDRTAVNLPFSRGAGVAGEPIRVPPMPTTRRSKLRAARSKTALNAATERAYAIVDRHSGDADRG